MAEISADIRFTFGNQVLIGGIETVSALIGLYCIPVLIDLVATPDRHLKVTHEPRGFRFLEALAISWKHKFSLLRSSVIGTLVGILPGAGGSIAGLVAYSEARRSSSRSEHFGHGEPEGVMATESANNATVGGGFIPTLVLGIPGTPPDAVILGALLIQGIRTGPSLFVEGASIVYTFIYGLFLATFLMLPVGLVIGRYAYKAIITIPKGNAGADGGLYDGDRNLCHPQLYLRYRHHDTARRCRVDTESLWIQPFPHRSWSDPGQHR